MHEEYSHRCVYHIERNISVIIICSVSAATKCTKCERKNGNEACDNQGEEEICDVNGDEVCIW